ncbi:MAG: hypothetical protein RLZZ546_406 [Bacteroidota bacterium]|jgi:glutathione S-transferase
MVMKLVYFDAKGLAETSRIILAIAGQEYEDVRYPIEFKDNRYVRDLFDNDVDKGLLERSMNKLPALYIDNHVICQSKAIERYLAKKFCLMGSDEFEEAYVDSICECIRDFKESYMLVKNDKDLVKKYFEVDLPKKLHDLSLMMNKNGSSFGYSVSNKITLSDITIYTFIMEFFTDRESVIKSCKHSPKIRSIVNNISSLARLQEYLKNRPKTQF